MDNRTKLLLVCPLLAIALLTAAATCVNFPREHTANERSMLDFTPTNLDILEQPRAGLVRAMRGPFDIVPPSAGFTAVASSGGSAADVSRGNGLTLTVVNGVNRMAMIDGVLVKEGDRIDDKIIARIEPQRVLIQGRFKQWIYLEREP